MWNHAINCVVIIVNRRRETHNERQPPSESRMRVKRHGDMKKKEKKQLLLLLLFAILMFIFCWIFITIYKAETRWVCVLRLCDVHKIYCIFISSRNRKLNRTLDIAKALMNLNLSVQCNLWLLMQNDWQSSAEPAQALRSESKSARHWSFLGTFSDLSSFRYGVESRLMLRYNIDFDINATVMRYTHLIFTESTVSCARVR